MIIIPITLGIAYYNQPFFNIRVEYNHRFGGHGANISIHLGGWNNDPILATINRNANRNETPRIMMQGNAYNQYVQANYQQGNVMNIQYNTLTNSILIP